MSIRKKFIFNGRSSFDFGVYLTGSSTFNAVSKSQNKVSVPGRNGDLIISNDRYENQNYVLHVGIIDSTNLHERLRDFRSFLLSSKGYCRLEDEYHPDEYRMAQFIGPVDFETTLLIIAETDLTFDCKPQHFLKSGEIKYSFEKSNIEETLYNTTLFNSNPLITISGYGTLKIGNGIIEIANGQPENAGSIICDCETMNSSFETGGNANSYVSVKREAYEHLYPQLVPGNNIIKFDSTITSMALEPRWWML